jgi:predicted Rossmann fold flavoprotein
LGHSVIPKRPALAPVLVDLQELKILQGVRADVGTRLWNGKKLLAEAAGNLIFTEWGLNGPAVMDISQAVSAHPDENLSLSLNFLQFFETDFFARLKENRSTDLPVKIFLGAYFPPKVTQLYLNLFHIPDHLPMVKLEEGLLQKLIQRLSDTRLPVNGTRGFEFCQVSAGGVPVAEVDPVTLESRLVKGLYLVGETVDVVGPCGGYNLHYAFASGALAGMAVGKQPD